MTIDVFWVWLFIFVGAGLLGCIIWSAAIDQQRPTQPPNSVVWHTQAVRKNTNENKPLYGDETLVKKEAA